MTDSFRSWSHSPVTVLLVEGSTVALRLSMADAKRLRSAKTFHVSGSVATMKSRRNLLRKSGSRLTPILNRGLVRDIGVMRSPWGLNSDCTWASPPWLNPAILDTLDGLKSQTQI